MLDPGSLEGFESLSHVETDLVDLVGVRLGRLVSQDRPGRPDRDVQVADDIEVGSLDHSFEFGEVIAVYFVGGVSPVVELVEQQFWPPKCSEPIT
ncbi:MAG: hypothetical protein JXB85_08795 [Anaerolineales bacterium]|nr:hypothetical protein [Anaerolineales bacterium]